MEENLAFLIIVAGTSKACYTVPGQAVSVEDIEPARAGQTCGCVEYKC